MPATAHATVDTSSPLWTVAYGDLGPAGNNSFPAPHRIAVTTAWFAVNRTQGVATVTAPTGVGGSGTAVDPALYGTADFHNFESPSGNVYCEFNSMLRCEVFSYDFQHPTPATAPMLCAAGSAAAANYGIIDATGKAGVGCQGDRGLVTPKVLPYGDSLTVGQFCCLSATTDVECVSTQTDHWIALSRAAMRVF